MVFDRPPLGAVLLALGIALTGLFVGYGFAAGRATDRFVEVKGLAGRVVSTAPYFLE